MKSVLIRLSEFQDHMTPSELNTARVILQNPDRAIELSVHQLAELSFTSSSTIIRLCQHLGFDGYKDLKRALQYELAMRKLSRHEVPREVIPTDTLESIIDKVTYKNIASLEETRNLIDVTVMSHCVDLIDDARILYLFGIGSSLCVANDAYLKFLRMGKPCVINSDWHSQLLQARNMTKDDVAIFLSYSGQTAELIECAKMVKNMGAPIILITRSAPSTLADMADYCLYVSDNEALFRNGAMSSRIGQLNVCDILYTAYASRHYEQSIEKLRLTHIDKPKYKKI